MEPTAAPKTTQNVMYRNGAGVSREWKCLIAFDIRVTEPTKCSQYNLQAFGGKQRVAACGACGGATYKGA
jgi:hypothetical protein